MGIWKKTNYTTESKLVLSSIYEYDIRKANISILLKHGAISQEMYSEFLNMNKKERQIKIGVMQKNDPLLKKVLEEGFEEARMLLITSNSITKEEIISIKKDAIFVTRQLQVTSFGPVEFVLKNRYDMFLKTEYPKLEFYYGIVSEEEQDLDVKGIKDEALPIHCDTWMTFLCQLFGYVVNGQIREAMIYLSSISKDYVNRSLPLEFYREFNSISHFRIMATFMSEFTIDRADESCRPLLNIDYNLNLLMNFNRIISELYMTSRRGGL